LPPSSTSAAVQLPPRPWTLRICRDLLAELLAVAAVDRPVADALALALTEACSNVVRHAPATDRYHVDMTVDDHCCTIRVRDYGAGFDSVHAGDTVLGGNCVWGLTIMRAMVDEVGIRPARPGTELTMTKHLRPRYPGGLTRGSGPPVGR
jgi:serine/threonine-protein kinase RsbW